MKKVVLGLMVTFMSVGAFAVGGQVTENSARKRAFNHLQDVANVEMAKRNLQYDELFVGSKTGGKIKETAGFYIFDGVVTGEDFQCTMDLVVRKSDGRVYENTSLKCQD